MSSDARLYIATNSQGDLSLGGPWAIQEVKGTGVNSVIQVTDATALALAANTNRKSALFCNTGQQTIYLCCTAGDDSSTGMPLPPGAVMPDNITRQDWYAVCDPNNSSELRVIEVSTT